MNSIILHNDSPPDPCKDNLLILFKFPGRWNTHIIKVLETEYNVTYGFYLPIYNAIGTRGISELVQKMKIELHIKALLIDPEWLTIFNIASVELLDVILPVGLMLFDDGPWHDYNRVLASRASFVLSSCPLSIMKYRELGIEAAPIYVQSEQLYMTDDIQPIYDVLWYGTHKADRNSYISRLESMTDLNIFIHTKNDLPMEELAKLIRCAKIIVNLSKSEFPRSMALYNSIPRPEIYLLTGRIIEAGFSGRLCISQYAPHHHYFGELTKCMKEFHTPEEMETMIRSTLESDRLPEDTEQFCSYIKKTCGDQVVAENIRKLIDTVNMSSFRYITRINQHYYNVAISAINGHTFSKENMRNEELNLLNQACAKVRVNFAVFDGSSEPTYPTKFFVAR